jgi:hypothetical protein
MYASPRLALALPLLLLACATDPTGRDDAPFSADYSKGFDPPLLVDGPPGCDRLITYATLGLQRDWMYDFSINVVDDCRQSGPGAPYFGLQRRGSWEIQGDTVLFQVNDSIPTFGGERDGDTFVLRLPPNFAGITNSRMELRLELVQAY